MKFSKVVKTGYQFTAISHLQINKVCLSFQAGNRQLGQKFPREFIVSDA